MTPTILINADDYGLFADADRWTEQYGQSGLVNAVSIVVNGDQARIHGLQTLLTIKASRPFLSLGIHLMLTDGQALTPPSSLTGPTGSFAPSVESFCWKFLKGSIRLSDVEREWEQQVSKLKSQGISPDHLDSHQHIHILPGLWPLARRLALRHGIRHIRTPYESIGKALLSGHIRLLLFQLLAWWRYRTLSPRRKTLGVLSSGALAIDKIYGPLKSHLTRKAPIEIMVHPGKETPSRALSDLQEPSPRIQEQRELQALKAFCSNPPNRSLASATSSLYRKLPLWTRLLIWARAVTCPFYLIETFLPKSGSVLDIGAGYGYLAFYARFSSPLRTITAIEPDQHKYTLLTNAGIARDGVTIRNSTAQEYLKEYPDSFDAILLLDVLYQLDKQQQVALLHLLAEKLNPGGRLILKEADPKGGWRFLLTYMEECLLVSFLRKKPMLRFHFRPTREWLELLKLCGFKDVAILRTPGEILYHSYLVTAAK